MKKKTILGLLTIVLSLSIAGCSGGSNNPPASRQNTESNDKGDDKSNDPQITLRYAEVNPADSLMGQTAKAFKEKTEELTDGSVKIDIQFSGVLGAESDVLDAMIGGAEIVDIARVATFSLNSYGATRTSLLSVPYTFRDREHFWAFASSDLGTELLNEPSDKDLGIRGLFYVEEGFRHFFFKNEIKDISDMENKKIRVSTDPIMTGMVDDLKAYPTVVSFNELYTSLSSGVVDAAEQPIVNYQSNAFNEVAPYMILDAHTLGCAEVIITDSAWEKLTDSQKAAIEEAGRYASEFNANLSADIENQCIAELEASGVTFVPVENMKEWTEACSDTISKCIEGMEEDYNTIYNMGGMS